MSEPIQHVKDPATSDLVVLRVCTKCNRVVRSERCPDCDTSEYVPLLLPPTHDIGGSD